MNIGIVCYASLGGSGIVATELAKVLASRGHDVHLISTEPPVRLGDVQAGLAFHAVQTPGYPIFREPQYLLSLANKIVQVSREFKLEIIHAHYVIPHAAAAYLARQILSAVSKAKVPRVITTLHGTDVTIVGSDESYSETAAFCINQSDGVTAVSENLRQQTLRELPVRTEVRVIPNFLDCQYHRRLPDRRLADRYQAGDTATKLVTHISNFRPVKRAAVVVDIFRLIRERLRARLLLVGDGPDLAPVRRRAQDVGLGADVETLGEQKLVVPFLSVTDLFLLPSSQESFGLAALEAMACGVPVVASRVGGLPEVIDHEVTGFLHPPDDLVAMATSGIALLTDAALHERIAAAGFRAVQERFCADEIVPRYEAFYREILAREPATLGTAPLRT
jgi:N-acetyl-alpha-D-glucosaminyl L-malate synthase BshA